MLCYLCLLFPSRVRSLSVHRHKQIVLCKLNAIYSAIYFSCIWDFVYSIISIKSLNVEKNLPRRKTYAGLHAIRLQIEYTTSFSLVTTIKLKRKGQRKKRNRKHLLELIEENHMENVRNSFAHTHGSQWFAHVARKFPSQASYGERVWTWIETLRPASVAARQY